MNGRLKGIALFISPLTYFVTGMLLLLFSTIFYPAIADAFNWTRVDIAARGIAESDYWALATVITAGRAIIFITSIMVLVVGVMVWWVKRK